MKKTFSIALLVLGLLSSAVFADIAVVVNRSSGVTSLSRNDAINIFMGRYRKLPGGGTGLPVDLEPAKARFYRALVAKDLSEINAYWARLMFSGQASPPLQITSLADLNQVVRDNLGAITYVDTVDVTGDMRIVLVLEEPGT